MKNKTSLILKYLALTFVLGVVIYSVTRVNVFRGYGTEEIRDYVNSFGFLSPVIYVVLLTLLPLLFFPDSILVIAGGMMFGLFEGVILTSIGSFLGATISFYISRLLGQKIVTRLIKGKWVDFEEYSKKSGFIIILMLRLIPLFPFKVVSYSAGLSKISFKDFTLATVIGSLPGIIVYTNLGNQTNKIGTKGFYFSLVLIGALFFLSFIFKNKLSLKPTEEETSKVK